MQCVFSVVMQYIICPILSIYFHNTTSILSPIFSSELAGSFLNQNLNTGDSFSRWATFVLHLSLPASAVQTTLTWARPRWLAS